jgi:hypothetical protein
MSDTTTVSNIDQDPDEELREQILVNKRRTGGDPSLLLDLLSELVLRRQSWKKRGEDGWSFVQYVDTPFDDGGLGWDRKEVEQIVDLQHKYEKDGPRHDPEKAAEMKKLRRTVRELLNPDAAEHGENQHTGDGGVRNTKSNGTDTESYAIRRLKRDAPELAEQVLDGKMSANAAAVEAGFRTKTASVPVHKGGRLLYERAAKAIAKRFDVETFIEHLREHL